MAVGASASIATDRLFLSRRGEIHEFRLEPSGLRVSGRPRRLVSFPGSYVRFAVNATGSMFAVTSASASMDMWTLPIHQGTGTMLDSPRRLTNDEASEWSPSVSADGRLLVYTSDRNGNQDIWLRDLATGKETQLTATQDNEQRARISPDGRRILYEIKPSSVILGTMAVRDVTGGEPRQVCESCARPGWAPDSDVVTYYSGDPVRFFSLRLSTGARGELVSYPKVSVQSMEFSPDGKWLSFHLPRGPGRSQVVIAPVRDGKAGPEAEWIFMGDDSANRIMPVWSRDGGRLYWMERPTIQTQRVDPTTKRPIGRQEKAFEAPAGFELGPGNSIGTAVTASEIFVTLQQTKGNLWKLERPQ